MLRAEIAKARYLPLPRWTAASVLAAAVITGAALIVFQPHNPGNYLDISSTALDQVLDIAAMVFGVWVAALEFGSGTLQRTLTAEPDRNRVLTSKIIVVLIGAAVVGAAAAATVGGLTHLAVIRAGAPVAAGDLARAVFAVVPDAVFAAAIGFGFGLLGPLDGRRHHLLSGVPLRRVRRSVVRPRPEEGRLRASQQRPRQRYLRPRQSPAQRRHRATDHAVWAIIIVVPGWVLFLRADQK